MLAALVMVVVVACRTAPRYAPIPDDGTFAHVPPAPDALARYRLASDYSRTRGGVALVVVDGDKVVFEDDENGARGDDPRHVFSGTKSFACAIAAAAVADRKLDLTNRVIAGGVVNDDRAQICQTLRFCCQRCQAVDRQPRRSIVDDYHENRRRRCC